MLGSRAARAHGCNGVYAEVVRAVGGAVAELGGELARQMVHGGLARIVWGAPRQRGAWRTARWAGGAGRGPRAAAHAQAKAGMGCGTTPATEPTLITRAGSPGAEAESRSGRQARVSENTDLTLTLKQRSQAGPRRLG